VKVDTLKGVFPVIFITLIVFVAVMLLSVVDGYTREQIEYQEEQKRLGMLTEMFPDMSEYDFEDDIYIIYADGAKIGYAFLAVGRGYGGTITILVGLENETTIKGIAVVSQSETPGLGARITESSFVDEFAGLNISEVAVKRDGGQIDALTGATISSRAVADAVRTTAMEKIKSLEEGE